MREWTDIGEQLRKSRESKGLDLKDVAHTTRIPLATLTALEESDYSIFPSPTYARSFLSQYSEYLNVDAHEWIDAFETGDVLSNVNDHGYLQSHNEHIGDHRHNPKPARRRGRNASQHDDSLSEKNSGGRPSILQTLTVFFVATLVISGGIYGYKNYEPMLKGAHNEEMANDKETADADNASGASSVTDNGTPKTPDKPKADSIQEPPIVAKHDPPTSDRGSENGTPPSADKPQESTKPDPIKPNNKGRPPKAMVVDED